MTPSDKTIRTCYQKDGTPKHRYESKAAAKRLTLKGQAPYKCPTCSYWHNGSTRYSAVNNKARRSRKFKQLARKERAKKEQR